MPPHDPELPLERRINTIKDVLGEKCSAQGAPCTKMAFDLRDQYKLFTLAFKGSLRGRFQVND